MVRKRFDVRGDQRRKKAIEKEVRILKRLSHSHIVKFVDMYEDHAETYRHKIYVLMSPVGDNDLRAFMHDSLPYISKHVEPQSGTYTKYLNTWPYCLASALAYLHKEGIQHEDIKPSNIIHRDGAVFFTDFGSSREVRREDTTSTAEPATATRLFAAPEALIGPDGELDRHGSQSDVFSLGLVFAEMLCASTGRPKPLRLLLEERSRSTFLEYHTVLEHLHAEMKDLVPYERSIRLMLAAKRQERPRAFALCRSIALVPEWQTKQCPCHPS
jgi:serine/threonine protein kinase